MIVLEKGKYETSFLMKNIIAMILKGEKVDSSSYVVATRLLAKKLEESPVSEIELNDIKQKVIKPTNHDIVELRKLDPLFYTVSR